MSAGNMLVSDVDIITINGEKWIKAKALKDNSMLTLSGDKWVKLTGVPSGKRAVVVVDRGWIYAGDVREENGRIFLTNAVWVFRWEGIGFDGVLKNPKDPKVQLRKMEYPVDVPRQSEVYRIPVPDDWGL